MSHVILTDNDGNQFRATVAQKEAIESLTVARAGGIATVYGYVAESGRVKPETYDAQILTRFSIPNLYKRKMLALADVTLSSIRDGVAKDPVLSKLGDAELVTLFNERKKSESDSMNKTLEGDDRSDSHRAGHDRCYARLADGIKVHYVTEKVDGIMQPVLTNGLPTVNSIMVAYLELNKTVRVPGEYKVVNSKAPVRINNLINQQVNSKSVGLKYLSLKEGNFERLVVARKSYLPEDVAGIDSSILNG